MEPTLSSQRRLLYFGRRGNSQKNTDCIVPHYVNYKSVAWSAVNDRRFHYGVCVDVQEALEVIKCMTSQCIMQAEKILRFVE